MRLDLLWSLLALAQIPVEPLPGAPLISVQSLSAEWEASFNRCFEAKTHSETFETPAGFQIHSETLALTLSGRILYFQTRTLLEDSRLLVSDCQADETHRACFAFHESPSHTHCTTDAIFWDRSEKKLILEQHFKAGPCTPLENDFGELLLRKVCSENEI